MVTETILKLQIYKDDEYRWIHKPATQVQEKLEGILSQVSEVFKDGIGTLKDIKARLMLVDNAQPRFHKVRPDPYGIRPKVET